MNVQRIHTRGVRSGPATAFAAVLGLTVLLSGCATPPPTPGLVDNLNADLQVIVQDEEINGLAPVAVSDARNAVRRASIEGLSAEEQAHRVQLARTNIEIARAQAFAQRALNEIDAIELRRNNLLLQASRLEVQQARRDAEQALMMSAATREQMERAQDQAMTAQQERAMADEQAQQAREEAAQARRLAEAQATEVELARREAELASQAADSLRRRLEYMEYRETDRGVVITLGDVLFEVGQTELLPAAQQNLNDVVDLLTSEPDKAIRIEGHTDATGPAAVNLRLSEQRARSVRDALAELGIDSNRMQAVGMGEDFPIASNESEQGRARNRRVDVIVLNN